MADRLPKQSHKKPWLIRQNYFWDMFALKWSALEDGVLKFEPSAASGAGLQPLNNPFGPRV